MRIIYIITRSDIIGGASIHVRDLAQRMLQEGHEVLVILGAGELLSGQLKVRDIPYQQIKSLGRAPHPLSDFKSLLSIYRKLRSWKPDIVSTHTSKAGLLGRIAASLLRIPVLYTPHCWSFAENFPNAKLYLWLERCFAFTTTLFVSVSEYERQQGISAKVCDENNCRTIHNGMPDLVPGRKIEQSQVPRIIMVARFEQQKDHRTLIDALAKLKELDWKLSLVGDGPLMETIKDYVLENHIADRIDFHGHSSDVAAHLSKADIFVLTTLWESFPRSILEAMRAGLPVIASDIGGCAESVVHQKTGFIVPAQDHVSLKQRLSELIRSPELRRRMGQQSRQNYEEKFTFETMFLEYRELYNSLV